MGVGLHTSGILRLVFTLRAICTFSKVPAARLSHSLNRGELHGSFALQILQVYHVLFGCGTLLKVYIDELILIVLSVLLATPVTHLMQDSSVEQHSLMGHEDYVSRKTSHVVPGINQGQVHLTMMHKIRLQCKPILFTRTTALAYFRQTTSANG